MARNQGGEVQHMNPTKVTTETIPTMSYQNLARADSERIEEAVDLALGLDRDREPPAYQPNS
jgi:hypothetical protein